MMQYDIASISMIVYVAARIRFCKLCDKTPQPLLLTPRVSVLLSYKKKNLAPKESVAAVLNETNTNAVSCRWENSTKKSNDVMLVSCWGGLLAVAGWLVG
jgi:hypothetical protein